MLINSFEDFRKKQILYKNTLEKQYKNIVCGEQAV